MYTIHTHAHTHTCTLTHTPHTHTHTHTYIHTRKSDNEMSMDRAFLLIDIHLKDLGIQKSLLTRNEMVAQRVSSWY